MSLGSPWPFLVFIICILIWGIYSVKGMSLDDGGDDYVHLFIRGFVLLILLILIFRLLIFDFDPVSCARNISACIID